MARAAGARLVSALLGTLLVLGGSLLALLALAAWIHLALVGGEGSGTALLATLAAAASLGGGLLLGWRAARQEG